jgi:hypothetical protein
MVSGLGLQVVWEMKKLLHTAGSLAVGFSSKQ